MTVAQQEKLLSDQKYEELRNRANQYYNNTTQCNLVPLLISFQSSLQHLASWRSLPSSSSNSSSPRPGTSATARLQPPPRRPSTSSSRRAPPRSAAPPGTASPTTRPRASCSTRRTLPLSSLRRAPSKSTRTTTTGKRSSMWRPWVNSPRAMWSEAPRWAAPSVGKFSIYI